MAKTVSIRYQNGVVRGPVSPQDFQRLTVQDLVSALDKFGENFQFSEIIISEKNAPNWREIRRVTGNTRAIIVATREGDIVTVWRNNRMSWIKAKHVLLSLFPALLRGEQEYIAL